MVEKRSHPLWALFLNQLIYAVVSFVIVTSMSGKLLIFFGLFFLFLYLSGIYSYAHKAGIDHQKSYSPVSPHIKYPFCYALIAIGYLWIPLGIYVLSGNWYVYLAVTFWESPFYFGHLIYNDGVLNLISASIFSGLILLTTGFGYWAGSRRFYLIRLVHKILYRPVEQDEQKS